MTITDSLIRIKNAKDNLRQSLVDKGISIPNDALLDEYSSIIDEAELYGPYYKNFYDLRTNNGTSMDALFARTTGELDLRQVDTSKITSMYYMFDNSSANVNIDGWDTSKVTNMSYMFNSFSGSIDISKLDTSSVTNVRDIFYYANTDKMILTGLSFPSATSLEYMFENAKGTSIDLSSWDISNIKKMYYMFNSADYKRIDLTGWKTTNVTDMTNMFYNYSNPLKELIIPDWDMTNTTGYSNFYYVGNSSNKNTLRLVDLSRSNDVTITKIASCLPTRTTTTYGDILVPSNTSQATLDTLIAKYWRVLGADLSPAPTSVEIVAELDDMRPGQSTRVRIGTHEPWNADTSKVEIVMVSDESIATIEEDKITSTGVIGDILLEARVIDTQEVVGTKTIVVSEEDLSPNVVKFRASSVTTSSYNTNFTVNGTGIKGNNTALVYDKYFDLYSYDAKAPITSLKFDGSYCILTELVKLNTSNITNMNSMFSNCKNLTSLDLSNFDTSKVTNMSSMFYNCELLTSLDLSNLDVSSVTNMNNMFNGCTNLTLLDLSNWDISSLTTTSNMFAYCNNITETKLCNWIIKDKTKPVKVLDQFYESNVKYKGTIDLSNWSFEIDDISGLFEESDIVSLDFSNLNWNTSNVTNMSNMFAYCDKLKSLDLRGLDTSAVTNMSDMFAYCSKLESLNLDEIDTSNVTNMSGIFSSLHSIQNLDFLNNLDTSNVTDMSFMFSGWTNKNESMRNISLNLNHLDVSNVTNMRHMFGTSLNGQEHRIKELDLSEWDVSKVTDMKDIFYLSYNLTHLKAPQNISVDLSLTHCSLLTRESLMSVINNLAVVTETKRLSLNSVSSTKLSTEDIAIATNKGWTVSSS